MRTEKIPPENAEEIVLNYLHMRDNPELIRAMRAAAPKMAARYTWEKVLAVLFEKINLAKCQQGTILPWQVHPYPIVEKTRIPKPFSKYPTINL